MRYCIDTTLYLVSFSKVLKASPSYGAAFIHKSASDRRRIARCVASSSLHQRTSPAVESWTLVSLVTQRDTKRHKDTMMSFENLRICSASLRGMLGLCIDQQVPHWVFTIDLRETPVERKAPLNGKHLARSFVRYSEGQPGNRYYGGNEVIDKATKIPGNVLWWIWWMEKASNNSCRANLANQNGNCKWIFDDQVENLCKSRALKAFSLDEKARWWGKSAAWFKSCKKSQHPKISQVQERQCNESLQFQECLLLSAGRS